LKWARSSARTELVKRLKHRTFNPGVPGSIPGGPATNSDILCVSIFLVENIFEISSREEKLSESCMTRKKKKEEAHNYERYTIFNALLDAMNEKKQKKSRWTRFLNRLGVNK
jgi:hypothetical protein